MKTFENDGPLDNIDRLYEIQEEIHGLMEEANRLVRSTSIETGEQIIYERWKAYPYGNIMAFVVGGGRYDTTFSDIVDELNEAINGEEF